VIKYSAILVLAGLALLTAPAYAHPGWHPAGSSYSSKHISFTYPSSWSRLPSSEASTYGSSLTKSAGGYVSLAALAGVDSINGKKHQAGVALLAKMNFTSSFRKKLKGNRQLFISKFEQGVKQSATHVVSVAHAHFAGQNAAVVQVLLNGGGTKTHDEFFVAVAPNGKSVDMAIMVAVPSSAWSKYGPAFASIAGSSSFQ